MYIGENNGSDTYIVNRTLEKLGEDIDNSSDGRLSGRSLVVLTNQNTIEFMKNVLSSPNNKFMFQDKPIEIINLFQEVMKITGTSYSSSYYKSSKIETLRTKLREYRLELMK